MQKKWNQRLKNIIAINDLAVNKIDIMQYDDDSLFQIYYPDDLKRFNKIVQVLKKLNLNNNLLNN